MTKQTVLALLALIGGTQAKAQIDAGLFRYPDVSQSQIAFSYANDIWIVPKEGGTAIRLVSPPGVEVFPKFSEDGKKLAFSANYDGNTDVYVLPVAGGIPQRLTQHGYGDLVVDWAPGNKVLFASRRESTKERFNQFYTIPENGGVAVKLPLAYAELGSYSPNGKQIAVLTKTQSFRNWKRYRGGSKADIHIYNFDTKTSENISAKSEAGNEFPMWHGDYIYFLSDRGTEKRMNLWRYHTGNKSVEQLTHYKDYDVHTPSLGPAEIVFEAGGSLHLLSLSNLQDKTVKISVTTDVSTLRPRTVRVNNFVQHGCISPDGKRVLVEARGEIFSVPAENGFVKNLTQTSGFAERTPSWSPDGKYIAYWSDKSGEYELWLAEAGKEQQAKQLTNYGPGFRYRPFWSPDSKKLAFIDQKGSIKILDITSRQTTDVDKGLRYSHGNLEGFRCSWSPDSRWLAYDRDMDNAVSAVFIFDTKDKKSHQITSGFYNTSTPAFDPEGKYLYVLTSQTFKPSYSDVDNTFIYANATQPGVINLQKSTRALLFTQNDTVAAKEEEKESTPAADKNKKDKKDKKDPKPADAPAKNAVSIDFEDIERRLAVLPVAPGHYSSLNAVKGKVLYINEPITGSPEPQGTLKFFDIEDREEKNIIKLNSYELSADGKKLLVSSTTDGIVNIGENQKVEHPLRLTEMEMTVDPMAEWKQLFMDTWRMERDYFYDANMHGLNWNEVKDKYLRILAGARTREEVNFVLGEILGEMNASHTYNSGGDLESPKMENVGYLGVNWEADGQHYKIKEIIRGAAWDAEARSPLEEAGVNIKAGDYILAVNGVPLTTAQEPFAAFQTLGNKAVELTYNSSPSFDGAKTAVVKTISNEYRLRHLAWIEQNRQRVAAATNNQIGYIFVPSTGLDGQNELIRQFMGQWDKAGLIIDERFNNGGQIPDRFIELLNRKPLAYWATRDGKPNQWPMFANFGPKVMLINAWSGSGGDAFPDYFRKTGLGPLIGTRTWGGLIGISGAPTLIDGGEVTVPTFRMYNIDGTWFKEGYGVDPDIVVDENLGDMARGIDPQLERAITEIKKLLENKAFKTPAPPAREIR